MSNHPWQPDTIEAARQVLQLSGRPAAEADALRLLESLRVPLLRVMRAAREDRLRSRSP